MRRILSLPIFAATMALANPVMAAEKAPESELIEKLDDPEFQDGLAAMMSGFVSAMMDIPIGQFAGSIEKAIPKDMRRSGKLSNIDRDATVGDLARRDDPDFEGKIDDKMRQGTAMMSILASELGALLPELRAIGDRMKKRIDQTR